MIGLGIAVIFANLTALLASIFLGMFGLIPANLVGVGAGVWVTTGLVGMPRGPE